MPLSCFTAAGDPSPAPPLSATSVYWTHHGTIILTWSRVHLGLLLNAELHFPGVDAAAARFVLRPWLPWRRRGSKRFVASGSLVAFSWNLSRARLSVRRPDPASRYSLSVSVDGELALVVGDLASPASAGHLLSRREHAFGGGGAEAYTTTVTVAGEPHEVSIAADDLAMWVAIDGDKALQVRRLRWKFRGSERLDLPHGHVAVSWDLHGWLFSPDAAAVFVLRFETAMDEADAEEVQETSSSIVRHSSCKNHVAVHGGGESWCSSDDSERKGWRWGLFKSGSDSSPSVSVASTTVASSAGSVATVAEWTTAEEAALEEGGGFSLVVHLWKKKR